MEAITRYFVSLRSDGENVCAGAEKLHKAHSKKGMGKVIDKAHQVGLCGSLGFSGSLGTNTVDVIRNSEDMLETIREEFACWGIDWNNDTQLKKLLVNEAIECINAESSKQGSPPEPSLLPPILQDAISFLLDIFLQKTTHGKRRLTVRRTRDLLQKEFGVNLPYAPYYRNKGKLILKIGYKNVIGIHAYLDDPMRRFIHYNEDASRAMTSSWTISSIQEKPNHIVDAATIHHILHGSH